MNLKVMIHYIQLVIIDIIKLYFYLGVYGECDIPLLIIFMFGFANNYVSL